MAVVVADVVMELVADVDTEVVADVVIEVVPDVVGDVVALMDMDVVGEVVTDVVALVEALVVIDVEADVVIVEDAVEVTLDVAVVLEQSINVPSMYSPYAAFNKATPASHSAFDSNSVV